MATVIVEIKTSQIGNLFQTRTTNIAINKANVIQAAIVTLRCYWQRELIVPVRNDRRLLGSKHETCDATLPSIVEIYLRVGTDLGGRRATTMPAFTNHPDNNNDQPENQNAGQDYVRDDTKYGFSAR